MLFHAPLLFNIDEATYFSLNSFIFPFRFPSDSLLHAFSVLSMRPLSFLGASDLANYGVKEIKELCDRYGVDKTASWVADGQTHKQTSAAHFDPDETKKEWDQLKHVVLAEHYPRDSAAKLWKLIVKFHGDDFPNIVKLAVLSLTLAEHTAGCECGFSVQNLLLTLHRNKQSVKTQEELMRVMLGPAYAEFNFKHSLEIWKKKKQRRLYEMKYQWNML